MPEGEPPDGDSAVRVMQKAIVPRKAGIRGKEDKAKHPKGYWSERCPHNRTRRVCKDCGGTGLCEHGRQKSICKLCGGKSICEHNRRRSRCRTCGGSSICPHNRHRPFCKECGGSQICQHGRHKNRCVDCGGSGICVHKRHKYRCLECKDAAQCIHKQPRRACDECRALREAGPESMAVKIHEALADLEKEGMLPEQLLPDGDPRKHSLAETLKSLRTVALAFAPVPRQPAQPQPRDNPDKSRQEDALRSSNEKDTAQIQHKLSTELHFTREHLNMHSRHLDYHPEAAAACIEGLPKHLSAMQRQYDAQVSFFRAKSKPPLAGAEASAVCNGEASKNAASPPAEAPLSSPVRAKHVVALSSDGNSHMQPSPKTAGASLEPLAGMPDASSGAVAPFAAEGSAGWEPEWGGGWAPGAGGWQQPPRQAAAWPVGLPVGADMAGFDGKRRSEKRKKSHVPIPFTPTLPSHGYPFGAPPDLSPRSASSQVSHMMAPLQPPAAMTGTPHRLPRRLNVYFEVLFSLISCLDPTFGGYF